MKFDSQLIYMCLNIVQPVDGTTSFMFFFFFLLKYYSLVNQIIIHVVRY